MTKLEEVARAQWNLDIGLSSRPSWDNADTEQRFAAMELARAAVEALRYPNYAIREALSRACSTHCFVGCDCIVAWNAGIDAILTEKPSHKEPE